MHAAHFHVPNAVLILLDVHLEISTQYGNHLTLLPEYYYR